MMSNCAEHTEDGSVGSISSVLQSSPYDWIGIRTNFIKDRLGRLGKDAFPLTSKGTGIITQDGIAWQDATSLSQHLIFVRHAIASHGAQTKAVILFGQCTLLLLLCNG